MAWNDFVRMNAKESRTLFVFVEGATDSAFYDFQIEKYDPSIKYEYIYCGNRDGVIATYNKVRNRTLLNSNKSIYIVDKDLHDYIGSPILNTDFFVTPTHSYENLLIDTEPLSRLWRSGIFKGRVHINYQIIKKKFIYAWRKFSLLLRRFHAVVACYKIDNNCELSRIKVKTYFKFDDNLNIFIEQDYLNKMYRRAGITNPGSLDAQCISDIEDTMKRANPKAYVRGKFELEFVRLFLDKLLEVCKLIDPNFSYRFENSDTGLVNYLALRTPLSHPFREYLDRMLV
ncbi:DUF4435 domain-containing protein [Deinococcus aestuarii]|uniref:DUF4435 domain-containing protein n=1 Tax=Deinococcus aestuarii TaxID=2774531 RepID=UPI001C0B2767